MKYAEHKELWELEDDAREDLKTNPAHMAVFVENELTSYQADMLENHLDSTIDATLDSLEGADWQATPPRSGRAWELHEKYGFDIEQAVWREYQDSDTQQLVDILKQYSGSSSLNSIDNIVEATVGMAIDIIARETHAELEQWCEDMLDEVTGQMIEKGGWEEDDEGAYTRTVETWVEEVSDEAR